MSKSRWMSQIRLRAIAQIGKISRELEKAPQSKGGRHDSSDAPTKTNQIEAAGLSIRTAERYEELAAPNAQLAPAFDSAFENYFATAEAKGKEPTFRGVAGALRHLDVSRGREHGLQRRVSRVGNVSECFM
jgi:hypothetical protein